MLNSKYAPVVALTVLGIIIIAVIGYFLAIKPQLDEASVVRAETETIEQNTAAIETASATLDTYQASLDELEPIDDILALNAPASFDRDYVAARIVTAVNESGLELATRAQTATESIPGWEADPTMLESNRVASLFEKGPVGMSPPTEFQPVVTGSVESGPVAQNLSAVGVSVRAMGTPAEALDFLQRLNVSEEQLFQVHSVDFEARQSDAQSEAGIADAEDGDTIVSITGYFYLLDAMNTIPEQGDISDVAVPGDSPFTEPEDAPDQPGAS